MYYSRYCYRLDELPLDACIFRTVQPPILARRYCWHKEGDTAASCGDGAVDDGGEGDGAPDTPATGLVACVKLNPAQIEEIHSVYGVAATSLAQAAANASNDCVSTFVTRTGRALAFTDDSMRGAVVSSCGAYIDVMWPGNRYVRHPHTHVVYIAGTAPAPDLRNQ